MMIVDAHTHYQVVGWMFMFGRSDEEMVAHNDKIGCDVAVSATGRALDRIPDRYSHEFYDDYALKIYEKSGGKVVNFFVFDPRMAELDLAMIEKYHDNPAFVGIKIHPSDHGVWATDERYRACWEAAKKYDLPIMSHTWALTSNPKQKYATPEQFVQFIDEYPEVKFIYGHSGGRVSGIKEAVEIGKTRDNVYYDIAGDIYNRHLVEFIAKNVGADKLMIGSDQPWFELDVPVGMVLGADLTSEEKELILGGNAARIFKLA